MSLPPISVAGAVLLLASSTAAAQHSPLIAETIELGGEVILADDKTGINAVVQVPLGRATDLRFGVGAADPDNGDADLLLRAGARALASERPRGIPFSTAVEGQLDVYVGENNTVDLYGGPSFGLFRPREGVVAYGQGLFLYTHENGTSDVKLGVRVGADYRRSDVVDLRGDFILSSEMQLRAALYLRPGRL